MTDEQIQKYHAIQNERFAETIEALPDGTVISFDHAGKHHSYTAEYIKRFVQDWRDSKIVSVPFVTTTWTPEMVEQYNTFPGGAGRKSAVISKPNAAITVEEYPLTDQEREELSLDFPLSELKI